MTEQEKQHLLADIIAHQHVPESAWSATIVRGNRTYEADVIRYHQYTFVHQRSRPFFVVIDASKGWLDATEVYQCCAHSKPGPWTVGVDEYLELMDLRSRLGKTSRVAQSYSQIDERRRSGPPFIRDLPQPCSVMIPESELGTNHRINKADVRQRLKHDILRELQKEMAALHWDFGKVESVHVGEFYSLLKSIPARMVSSEKAVGARYFDVGVDFRSEPKIVSVFIPLSAAQVEATSEAFNSRRGEVVQLMRQAWEQ
ncbi:MAG: hypothetical protein AAB403_12415 [Planctomycetota bacterium]